MPANPRKFGTAVLVVAILASVGATAAAMAYFLRPTPAPIVAADAPPPPKAPAPIRYQCPMHPNIIRDHPGECPICGMKLVPMEEHEEAHDASPAPSADLSSITIDPERQQLIGLRTAEVVRGRISGQVRSSGRVAIDETRVRHINVKSGGFVEHIYVDFVGKAVKRGEPLFTLYSPELLSAQNEYLLALRTRDALAAQSASGDSGKALVASARRRLALWDIAEVELKRLEETREPSKALTIFSPISGVVSKKEVVQGMKLDPGAMPYEIVDLSTVWVLADVYENEIRLVKEGTPATLKLRAFPNETFQGKVLFIDPFLDPQTRTVKVRLSFPNPRGALRPEMFGEVTLAIAPREGLLVPADAVIDSGEQKVVFVSLGNGKFEPRTIEVGQSNGSEVEVLSGLNEGEQVVIRANFLVDSESRLRASLSALARDAEPPAAARVLPATGSDAGVNPHQGHGR